MNQLKKTLNTFLALIGLFALGGLLDILPIHHIYLFSSLPSFYYLLLAIGLLLYFANIVVGTGMRKYLIAIAIMILLWLFLRIEKYMVFTEDGFMTRLLWYAYYIPMLSISWLSFAASLRLGKPKPEKIAVIPLITGIITAFFIVLVLTNDLHNLVFSFENGFTYNLQNYSRGLAFWLANIWNYALMTASLVITIVKSQIAGAKKNSWILIVYCLIFAIWLVLLVLDLRPKISGKNFGEFPETMCFLAGGLWLLCLDSGLVSSNNGYGKILSASSMSVLITDADYKLIYQSKTALPMTKEQLSKEQPFLLNPDTRVHRKKVAGGFAYWQVDLTQLNKLNAQLDDVNEALSEESELIAYENELKQKRAELDARSKTYDEIAIALLPQSKKVEELAGETREHPELFGKNMELIAIYTSYIKRMSNLILLASRQTSLSRDELKLAFSELARHLNNAGIIAAVNSDEEDLLLPADSQVQAFAVFFELFEEALPQLKAVCVTFIGSTLKLVFEGVETRLPSEMKNKIKANCQVEEGTSFIRLELGEEKS